MPPQLLALIFNRYVLGILFVLALGGYIYFLRSSIESLRDERIKLLVIVEEQTLAIAQIRRDIVATAKAKDDLVKTEKKIDSKKKLQDTLFRENRKKKSLEEIAQKKTTLVQKLVNNATQKLFDCFEIVSNGGEC
jgi:hypothetical protein